MTDWVHPSHWLKNGSECDKWLLSSHGREGRKGSWLVYVWVSLLIEGVAIIQCIRCCSWERTVGIPTIYRLREGKSSIYERDLYWHFDAFILLMATKTKEEESGSERNSINQSKQRELEGGRGRWKGTGGNRSVEWISKMAAEGLLRRRW